MPKTNLKNYFLFFQNVKKMPKKKSLKILDLQENQPSRIYQHFVLGFLQLIRIDFQKLSRIITFGLGGN